MSQIAYDLAEAAGQVKVSLTYLRQAIHATGSEDQGPPPLRAKKVGRSYRILHTDLEAWAASLPDA